MSDASAATANLAPASGVLLGAYVKPDDHTVDGHKRAITNREKAVGRRFDIVHTFQQWEHSIIEKLERWNVEQGRIPLVSWNGPTISSINSGRWDEHIDKQAKLAANFGHKFFLRWFWEMDADAAKDRVPGPDAFISAWRKIHRRFRNAGANNALFVWCPTSWGFETGNAQKYYPGDNFVDWVCADAFNWYPGRSNTKWREFDEMFDAFHQFGRAHGKPMMVGAFGVQEDTPGRKAQWLRRVGDALKVEYPGIRAVVYFDAKKEHDWRIDTSSGALDAWRNLAIDPYLDTRARATTAAHPTVTLTQPANGRTIKGTVKLAADASASGAKLRKVEFSANSTVIGTAWGSPWEVSWNTTTVPNGEYAIVATATDADGLVARSLAAVVKVDNPSPPVVQIASPGGGTTSGGPIWLDADVTPAEGRTVRTVEFLAGDRVIAKADAPGYSVTWNSREIPNGTYQLRARATDDRGFTGESKARSLTVQNNEVRVVSPGDGAVVKGVATIEVSATPQAGEALQVLEVRVAGNVVASLREGPFVVKWDSTKLANGTYALTARMVEKNGRVTTTPPERKVVVRN